MTLVEVLVGGLLLGMVLWLLGGLYDRGLDSARTRQAHELIRTLDVALRAYHESDDTYPPGQPNGTADGAIGAMLQAPGSAKVLGGLEARLLHLRDGRAECLDPWGRQPRYLTARISDVDLQHRVNRNGGEPIFESAGPDGRFGQAGDRASSDDVRTDEPLKR